jgi:chloramphenicol 3-O-phosphotransferase
MVRARRVRETEENRREQRGDRRAGWGRAGRRECEIDRLFDCALKAIFPNLNTSLSHDEANS